jgi:hypothetical protein
MNFCCHSKTGRTGRRKKTLVEDAELGNFSRAVLFIIAPQFLVKDKRHPGQFSGPLLDEARIKVERQSVVVAVSANIRSRTLEVLQCNV